MAQHLPEILPDLLEDGNPIKAETRNIEYLSAKTRYYQKEKVCPRLPDVWGKKDTPFYIMGQDNLD